MSHTGITAAVVAAVAAFAGADAYCAQQRTFVASYGSDTNLCKIAAPCRTLAPAVAQTLNGGEVIVLDGAEYGTVTITKSIAIVGPRAVYAGISVTSGAGIIVNAPGTHVRLEGLSLKGFGGAVGLRVDAAGLVVVERCTIEGFSDAGIRSSVGDPNILVHHTTIQDNGVGIVVDGPTRIVVEHGHLDTNVGAGMRIGSGAAATIANSVVAFNGTHGLLIQPAAGTAGAAVVRTLFSENGGDAIHASAVPSTNVTLSLSTSELRRNANGLAVDATTGATVGVDAEDSAISDHAGAGIVASNTGGTVKFTISGNVITRNGTGVANSGALFESRGNNTFNYNGSNGGPLTLFAPM